MQVRKGIQRGYLALHPKFRSMRMGLDIGSQQLKLVVLQQQGKRYSVLWACAAPLPVGAMSGHKIRNYQQVGQTLKAVLDLHQIPRVRVSIALPNHEVMTQLLQLPTAIFEEDESTIEQLLLLEIEKHIPYALAHMHLDYQILGPGIDPSQREVLVVATKAEVVAGYEVLLAEAGLKAEYVDVEQYAVARAYPWLDLSSFAAKPILNLGLVDFGAQYATFTVMEGTQALYCQEQRITQEGPVSVEFIAQWVERALTMFYATGLKSQLDGLLLSGGNYPLEVDLIPRLSQALGLRVAWANPFVALEVAPGIDAVAKNYVLSLGLALRGLHD